VKTRRFIPLAAVIAALAAFSAFTLTAQGKEHAHHGAHKRLSPKALAFHDGMRKLWEDHITWTRLAIVSFAAGLPDFDQTAGRLMANQEDIGNAIKPFYGKRAGNQLTSLLKAHIAGAVDVLKAAKAGDNAGFAKAKDSWYRNGDQIAQFLHRANPKHWALGAMKAMMRVHLDQTLQEASARLKGDFAADIRAYDEVHAHILQMADMLSSGIMEQFPARFR